MNRNDILKRDLHRKSARLALGQDGKMVISSLHPKALLNRWKAEQLSKISRVLEQGKDFVKEHPRLLTGTGVAILLLTATRPFRNLLRRKRGNKKSNVDNIE